MKSSELYSRAMRFLARREYSRAELRRRLLPVAGEEVAALEEALDRLVADGYLSDVRYAEQLVHTRGQRYGSLWVAHELRQKGVPEAIIETHLPDLKEQDVTRATDAIRRKYGSLARDQAGRAKQMRFLQSRGFGMNVILRVMRADPDEWPFAGDE